MKLSSSNGTQLAIEKLRESWNLLHEAYLLICEINEGTYNRNVDPIQFDATTCKTLDSWMSNLHRITKKLENVVYHKEPTTINGNVSKHHLAYKTITSVKPIKHEYPGLHPKYSCPVCDALGNKYSIPEGFANCPNCNVNLIWTGDEHND